MKTLVQVQKVEWKRAKIMRNAWELCRGGMPYATAVRTAWQNEKVAVLKELLPKCVEVRFEFVKTNGELRKARGTTFEPVMQMYNSTPQGYVGNHNPETHKPFMDIDKAEADKQNKWSSLVLAHLKAVKGYIYAQ